MKRRWPWRQARRRCDDAGPVARRPRDGGSTRLERCRAADRPAGRCEPLRSSIAPCTLRRYRALLCQAVFWATVCKTVRPTLSDRCLSVCSICNVGVLWPNGRTDQDETWHEGRPRSWPHCVRWGPSSPPPKGHSPTQPPNFRSISVVAKWLDGSRCHLVWRKDSAQATVAKRLDGSRWHLA